MADHQDILDKNDCGLSEARGILTHIFRQILMEMNVRTFKWDKLMRSYLMNPANRIPQNSKDRSSARGNLNKELRRDKMTWKVFVKALRFLAPTRIRFEVHLYWPGRPDPTVHAAEIKPSALDLDLTEDDN